MVSVVVGVVVVVIMAEGCPGTGIGTALVAGAEADAAASGSATGTATGEVTEVAARAARNTLYSRVGPTGARGAVGDIDIEAGEASLGDARDSWLIIASRF